MNKKPEGFILPACCASLGSERKLLVFGFASYVKIKSRQELTIESKLN